MKFIIGPVPVDENYHPIEEGWQPLREPNVFWVQVLSIPVGFLNLLFIYFLSLKITGFNGYSLFKGVNILPFIVAFIIVIPVHELLHYIVIPSGQPGEKLIGFWPKTVMFYAHFAGELTRNRHILVSLIPFLLLSLLPILLMGIFGFYNEYINAVALVNALLACADILGSVIIMQVPRDAVLKNNGWKSYWKRP